MSHVRRRKAITVLLRALLLGGTVLLVGPSAAGQSAEAKRRPPTLLLNAVSVYRTPPTGQINTEMRYCAALGPRAEMIVSESYVVAGRTKRSRTRKLTLLEQPRPKRGQRKPTPPRFLPYRCRKLGVSGTIDLRLLKGAGSFIEQLRVRDRFGQLTAPIAFSWRPGG
jgi:hypothetical protein